jgi:hypothetical protein
MLRVTAAANPAFRRRRGVGRAAETKLANGAAIDVGEHALLCSTLTRLAQRIGIDRVAKNITPTLADLLHAPADEDTP